MSARHKNNGTSLAGTLVWLVVFCLNSSHDAFADILRSQFALPNFPEKTRAIYATDVAEFSNETSTPWLAIETLNHKNLMIQMSGRLPTEWNSHSLILRFNNQNAKQTASLCNNLEPTGSPCKEIQPLERGTHPHFPKSQTLQFGPLKVSLLHPSNICKQTVQCELRVPAYYLKHTSTHAAPTLSRLIVLAHLDSSIRFMDGERGKEFFGLTDFPVSAGHQALGTLLSLHALHRGSLTAQFENAFLKVDMLTERGLFAGRDGRVWNVHFGANKTAWWPVNVAYADNSEDRCSGHPISMRENLVLYPNCVVDLNPHSQTLDAHAVLLSEKLQTAMVGSSPEDVFLGWNVRSQKIKTYSIATEKGQFVIKEKSSLPFNGRAEHEVHFFADKILRSTAFGIYKITAPNEERTTLSHTDTKLFFSGDGNNVMFGRTQGNNSCRWTHMTSKDEKNLQWSESGFSVDCQNTFITPSAKSLTVTTLRSRKVEIFNITRERRSME